MTLREITSRLLAIKCRLYPDLTPEERAALQNAATVLTGIAQAYEGVFK